MARKNKAGAEISRAIAHIHARVLAFVMGIVGGLTIFIMTAWLLIKGGDPLGPHLQLLANYFIGYSVSWPGCFVGMGYGALVGAIAGWSIGIIYNRIAALRHRKT